MISTDVSDLFTHRLQKLAKSGLSSHEIASSIQKLMEVERTQKVSSDQAPQDNMLPFFSTRRSHLNVV